MLEYSSGWGPGSKNLRFSGDRGYGISWAQDSGFMERGGGQRLHRHGALLSKLGYTRVGCVTPYPCVTHTCEGVRERLHRLVALLSALEFSILLERERERERDRVSLERESEIESETGCRV